MSQDHRIVSYRDLTLAMRRAILDNMMKAQSNMWRVLHEEVQEEERSTKMECALDEILQLAEETRRAAQFWIDGLEDLKEEPRELKVEETEEVDTREKQGDEGSITEKLPGLVVQSTSES